jgi:hypothetical protein
MVFGEHLEQTFLPHTRQWCLALKYRLPIFAVQTPQQRVFASQLFWATLTMLTGVVGIEAKLSQAVACEAQSETDLVSLASDDLLDRLDLPSLLARLALASSSGLTD